jgi:hypothetical protein
LARNIEVEDSGVAAVRWRSGAMGTLNVTMLTYPKNMEGSITISRRYGGQQYQQFGIGTPHSAVVGKQHTGLVFFF